MYELIFEQLDRLTSKEVICFWFTKVRNYLYHGNAPMLLRKIIRKTRLSPETPADTDRSTSALVLNKTNQKK